MMMMMVRFEVGILVVVIAAVDCVRLSREMGKTKETNEESTTHREMC